MFSILPKNQKQKRKENKIEKKDWTCLLDHIYRNKNINILKVHYCYEDFRHSFFDATANRSLCIFFLFNLLKIHCLTAMFLDWIWLGEHFNCIIFFILILDSYSCLLKLTISVVFFLLRFVFHESSFFFLCIVICFCFSCCLFHSSVSICNIWIF